MLIDYETLRPNDERPDLDRYETTCPCGARLVIETGAPPGLGFFWIVTHGDGEARYELRDYADRLLWVIGVYDPIGAWIDQVHMYELGRVLAARRDE